jgi:hypothetical protein
MSLGSAQICTGWSNLHNRSRTYSLRVILKSLLHVFKTKEQPLELVLPRKCPIHTGSQGMDGVVEQTLSSSLRVLSITRILFNGRCFTVVDLLFSIRIFEEQNDPSDWEVLW